ncbi:hypothetical protein DFH07DRAFT_769929 [Mycena maculata]|uniref:Uncharacterized protein n=1 Tax=Mycena maculata TaxID=230809 RepID=A0AAD7JN43_9AGAR|nr:hypothetical protein DFH07DRAFT_769929 [Mycena maculata]
MSRHLVDCDLCGTEIKLTVVANIQRLTEHRGSDKCRKAAMKRPQASWNATPTAPAPRLPALNILPQMPTTPFPGPTTHTRNPSMGTLADSSANLHTSAPIPSSPHLRPPLVSNLPCPGVAVDWTPGSIWATYPYLQHEVWSIGWEPIAFGHQKIFIRAENSRRLRAKIENMEKSNSVLNRKINDHRWIMMLLASNDVAGLRCILTVALRQGASAHTIFSLLEQCLSGRYSPRGGFNDQDYDISFLVKAIGGPKLLYAFQKSHGLASLSTVRRHQKIPCLLASIGIPSHTEIDSNIAALFDSSIKPAPERLGTQALPGNIAMFDGVALETKCSDKTKVCFGNDGTVVAIAPYARDDHYSATPIVLSPSDKSEGGEALAVWMQTVLDAWKENPNGERTHGPIWSLGSDGDPSYRLSKHILCMVEEIDPNSEVGKKIHALRGLNLRTSKDGVVATCDPKHVIKRFSTLLRSSAGLMINDTMIKPQDIIKHLCDLPHMGNEDAELLLDPMDKQNVPKAVTLEQKLSELKDLPPPSNPTDAHNRKHIVFFSQRNFDAEQLAEKLTLAALINAAFHRNPDLDRGSRRLSLKGALGIDRVNPRSWLGNVHVGDVALDLEWYKGMEDANRVLQRFFGPDARVDFIKLFSQPNCDMLRPVNGHYVGLRPSLDDHRSESENTSFSIGNLGIDPEAPPEPVTTPEPNIPEDAPEDPNSEPQVALQPAVPASELLLALEEENYRDVPLGVQLDDFIPETIDEIDKDKTPIALSRFLTIEGKKYLKPSIIASLSSNRSKKAAM